MRLRSIRAIGCEIGSPGFQMYRASGRKTNNVPPGRKQGIDLGYVEQETAPLYFCANTERDGWGARRRSRYWHRLIRRVPPL